MLNLEGDVVFGESDRDMAVFMDHNDALVLNPLTSLQRYVCEALWENWIHFFSLKILNPRLWKVFQCSLSDFVIN